jgi:two-component system, chemotaxis family, chemotaxis protein CheY
MRHVLVVDDSTVVRKIVRRILESADVRISEASNARQALAACSISMPDAILVDVDMPTPDGHEFLRQLRRMQGGNRPKVVICLNENDVAQIARAMHAGADDFMMKPFDADHVRSIFKFVSTPTPHEPGEAAIPLRVNRQRFPESNSVRPILPIHPG